MREYEFIGNLLFCIYICAVIIAIVYKIVKEFNIKLKLPDLPTIEELKFRYKSNQLKKIKNRPEYLKKFIELHSKGISLEYLEDNFTIDIKLEIDKFNSDEVLVLEEILPSFNQISLYLLAKSALISDNKNLLKDLFYCKIFSYVKDTDFLEYLFDDFQTCFQNLNKSLIDEKLIIEIKDSLNILHNSYSKEYQNYDKQIIENFRKENSI